MQSTMIKTVSIILLAFVTATAGYSEDYKLTSGDVVEIIVYGHEELSRLVTVKDNGNVDFPFLQNIPVDGLSLDELREIIVIQLSKFLPQKPLVSVIIPETYPIEITVLGQVVKPGAHMLKVNSTVQGAIGMAGGFLPGADLTKVKIVRKSIDSDSATEFIINIKQFLIEGNEQLLPRLQPGDMIIVPSYSGSSTVKVLGEVNRPGSYEMMIGNDSLLDIIFMAGGFTKEANTHKLKIISPHKQTKNEINIDLTKTMQAADFQALPEIMPGDIIYVSKNAFSWKKFISLLRDVTTVATLYVLIDRLKNN